MSKSTPKISGVLFQRGISIKFMFTRRGKTLHEKHLDFKFPDTAPQ